MARPPPSGEYPPGANIIGAGPGTIERRTVSKGLIYRHSLDNMHLSGLGLLALGAATASAFRDTSPFFLASTSEYVAERIPCGLELSYE